MTTEGRDPLLQTLFREAEQELDGTLLTERVMARTRRFRLLLLGGSASAVLLLLGGAWLLLGIPLFEFAVLISGVLATPIFDLGQGWLALLLLPVNTLASLLVLMFKAVRFLQKRAAGSIPAGL
jgi:hypothetical protein